MSNYFLGFFPDEKSNHKIRKIVGEVGRVFDGQGINVRWTNPQNFHVTLVFLGANLNFIQMFLLNNKLKNLIIPKFKISFDKCELGINRQYKELLYITTKDGGEHLRNLVFSLRKLISTPDYSNYIPHLTLGRVSKDLTNEEYRNIVSDLHNINEGLNLGDISFESTNMWLVQTTPEGYKFLRKFETA